MSVVSCQSSVASRQSPDVSCSGQLTHRQRATGNGQRTNEIGVIRKNPRGRIRVALVYPNYYHVGMSSLGFQAVYHFINEIEYAVCERAFLPKNSRMITEESGRLLSDFDIIAFSVSFENDYSNLFTILEKANLPPLSDDRNDTFPLVIAGGVACFLNPEPIAPFTDCFLIGEAEKLLPPFFSCFHDAAFATDRHKKSSFFEKKPFLKHLARNVPGAYVPGFYRTAYHKDGTIQAVEPLCDVPARIPRVFLGDLSRTPTCSTIVTPDTTFRDTFLIEVSRGCPHGCRFCSAGYVYRPPRFRPLSLLKECLEKGASLTNRIGLMGAAVSDLPGLTELCSYIEDIKISFSSLRADALTPELIASMKQSRVRTATIAPDAGSERMRRVINKGITEDDILSAAEGLVSGGIPNLKLYFMIGLPTETEDDIRAITDLCKKIKQFFLASSRAKKRIGEITVSLNVFVPKPFTPFQWAGTEDIRALKKKIKQVKKDLKRVANIRVHAENPRHAQIQALFSRGDRRVAEILSLAHRNRGNWPMTLKESPFQTDFYVNRARSYDEPLPWDIIDHGVRKSFLERENRRALEAKVSPPCRVGNCNVCGVCEVLK
ncbi:radical SAM protein [Desulfococcaceae bacterium HSG8]|nr:radical SAM protein [Desulfococcaceae bacterium HSG8]